MSLHEAVLNLLLVELGLFCASCFCAFLFKGPGRSEGAFYEWRLLKLLTLRRHCKGGKGKLGKESCLQIPIGLKMSAFYGLSEIQRPDILLKW